MIQDPAVLKVLDLFENEKIDYMISGSVASMMYAKPRMTHDIDIVVDLKAPSSLKLIEKTQNEYHISEEGIKDAIANNTMFNLIHIETGFKIDCWILTDSSFDGSRFARRQRHKIDGREFFFSTPEDTLLIKLVWLKDSENEKHAEDISDLLRLYPGKLDLDYIWKWIEKLGLRYQADMVKLTGRI